MDEGKKSVILYTEWAQPLKALSLEDKGRIFDAILSYSETGETPHFDSNAAEMAFSFIRLRIDENAQKWAYVRQKRREAGRRGALVTNSKNQQSQTKAANADFAETVPANVGKKRQSPANPAVNVNVNANANVNANVNVSSNEDIDGGYRGADKPPTPPSSSGRKRFVPPTLEEVAAYCNERHNGVNPSAFVDFYSANGWVQGRGKPIRDWKAAVRTWERRDKENPKPQQTRSAKEDYDEIFGGLL